MTDRNAAFEANRLLWNARTPHHIASKMYDVESFVAGRNSLTAAELDLLGDVRGDFFIVRQRHGEAAAALGEGAQLI